MSERIYLSSPDVGEAEEEALVRAIRSGWVAPLGPEVDAFEAELAAYCGVEHCVALSLGHGRPAPRPAHLGVGARATSCSTSTMTFAATANAITYTGAEPVFVDCDETGNIDPALLAEAFVRPRAGRAADVAAVVPVDLLGKVADYARDRRGRRAPRGARPRPTPPSRSGPPATDARPGSFGGAAVLSFNGNKIMTTSGGGMLLTDDAGPRRSASATSPPRRASRSVHYEHTEIGYNYRLSNLLAALGRAQLARLDEMMERRRPAPAALPWAVRGRPGRDRVR